MQLKLFRHLWGIAESWDEAFPHIKAAGYDGVEAALPATEDEAHWQDLLEQEEVYDRGQLGKAI